MKSKINKFFAWIIVILLVLGLVGFGLQDVLSRWGTSKLATVGEIEIESEEFAKSFIREISYISQNLEKNVSIEEAISIGVHLRVLEKIINRSLLDQLLKDLQISIGDESLLKKIKANTNFQDINGNFNRETYKSYLGQINLTESEFENVLRNDLSRELVTQLFDINMDYNKYTTKTIADFVGEERKVSFYKLKEIQDEQFSITEENDLINYYEKNKNKYLSKLVRKYSLLNLNQFMFFDDIDISDAEIKRNYEERKNEFYQQELRELNRIIFPTLKLAEEAMNKISANEKTFEEIGETLNLTESELYIGTYSKQNLEQELGNFIFEKSNTINSVIGPINGKLGFEIYKIVNILPEKRLEVNKAKNIILEEMKSDIALDKLAEIIPEIEDKIASGDTLEKISKDYSLNLEQIEIKKGEKVPEKYRNKNLESFFDAATYENSDLLQFGDNNYISIRLDEEIEPIIPDFTEIYDDLLKDFEKIQKLNIYEKKTIEILSEYNLNDAIKESKILYLFDDIIDRQQYDHNFLSKNSIENIFKNSVGDYVIQKISNTSIPYILIIKTDEIIDANTKSNYGNIVNTLQNQINEQFNNDIINALLNSLKETYKPKINYQLLNQILENLK